MRKMLLVWILAAVPAGAQTTYTYNGPTYTVTDYGSGSCFATSCQQSTAQITGSFTTSLSLADLASRTLFNIPVSDITSLNFTDGDGVVAASVSPSDQFMLTTDSQGRIDGLWGFVLYGGTGLMGMASIGGDFSQTSGSYGGTGFETFGQDWSDPVDPAPTPEPPSFVLALAAILLVSLVLRAAL